MLIHSSAPDARTHSLGDHFESDEEVVDILCRVSDLVFVENSHDENEEEISSLSSSKANMWPDYSKRLRAEIAAVPELAKQFYAGLLVFIYESGDPEVKEVDVTASIGSPCRQSPGLTVDAPVLAPHLGSRRVSSGGPLRPFKMSSGSSCSTF